MNAVIKKIAGIELASKDAKALALSGPFGGYIVKGRKVFNVRWNSASNDVSCSCVWQQCNLNEKPLAGRGKYVLGDEKTVNAVIGYNVFNA